MLLSVRLQTYNQQAFIEQALQGIEDQITNFNFEVVIGDDFSTDNNVKIIEKYISNSKNLKIEYKFLSRKKGDEYWKKRQKLGRLYNFINIIENCTGKYISLLEGDDYWTDPLKLQKQVDFLERNKDYAICFHEAAIEWNQNTFNTNVKLNSQFIWNRMNSTKSVYTISDLFNGPFMATASVIYRNNFIKEFPSWFYKAASGDITLYPLILGDKKIKFINEIMCVYRRHPEGITRLHKGNSIILNRIKILAHINIYYKKVYFEKILESVNGYLDGISTLNFKDFVVLVELYLATQLIKKDYLFFFLKKWVMIKLKR